MKSIRTIFIMLLLLASWTNLTSCCKTHDYAVLEIRFEDFDFSTMNSVLLIKTDSADIDHHLDTIFYDLSRVQRMYIPVYDSENGNYIVKNTSPTFEHHITEIDTERNISRTCSDGRIKFSFKFDGSGFGQEKKHSVVIKK